MSPPIAPRFVRISALCCVLWVASAGCPRDFELPGGTGPELCGNTELNPREECEDGNLSINDGCPSGPLGTCLPASCGDGFAWVEGYGANEECDDGNDLSGDGCYRCQLEEHWQCDGTRRGGDCWCTAGYQDHDGDGTCRPSCSNIDLPATTAHQVCDDSSGEVSYACAADAAFDHLDGQCELTGCDPGCGLYQDCVNDAGVYSCSCREHWTGTDCSTCRVLVDPSAACTDCDGQSWATAVPTLQGGIDLAALRAEGYSRHCEVWVKEGHYWVYRGDPQDTIQMRPWVALMGGFAGTEQTRDERDWRSNRTILDGHAGPDSTEQSWHVIRAASDSVIDGFVITGGRAAGRHGDDEQTLDDDGGALLLHQVQNVRVANSAIVGNSARTEGGAARILLSSVVFENCSFVGNSTWNDVQFNRGAAILSNWSATVLDRCVLAGNHGDGNAVSLWNASFRDANLVSNSIAVGNGTHTVFDNNYSSTRFLGVTVADNQDEEHGAIMHNWYTLVRAQSCVFGAHGGTDLHHNGAGMEVSHSLVEGLDCGGNGSNCAWGASVVDASPGFRPVSGTATGVWDQVSWDPGQVETLLTDTDAGWTPGERVGLFVQTDGSAVHRFPIHENTDSTLVVLGDLRSRATAGGSYQIFDYRLDPSSAAVDLGADLGPEGLLEDLVGAPRNICHTGTLPDCFDAGAYELQ